MGGLQTSGFYGVSAVATYDYMLNLQNMRNLCTATVSSLHPNKFKTKKKKKKIGFHGKVIENLCLSV